MYQATIELLTAGSMAFVPIRRDPKFPRITLEQFQVRDFVCVKCSFTGVTKIWKIKVKLVGFETVSHITKTHSGKYLYGATFLFSFDICK